mmetsp:Transcript_8708/g.12873  ORF Transcript_8708/g.12873 Transcript_8708/m.12873 type:complete len:499 (-) Transcript_8708:52-1548(-)
MKRWISTSLSKQFQRRSIQGLSFKSVRRHVESVNSFTSFEFTKVSNVQKNPPQKAIRVQQRNNKRGHIVNSILELKQMQKPLNAWLKHALKQLSSTHQATQMSIAGNHLLRDYSQKLEKLENEVNDEPAHHSRFAEVWLLTICALVALIIFIGGLTRLTESGLSMVNWSIHGRMLPSNDEEWEKEFDEYKKYPEYKQLNSEMTVDQFKNIFYYEYGHRMLGRFIGLVYFVGLGGCLLMPSVRRSLAKVDKRRFLTLGGLIGFQGLLGWYMVKSGLDDSEGSLMHKHSTIPRVSQYRLASHLATAFSVYAVALWSFLDLHYRRCMPKDAFVSRSTLSRLTSYRQKVFLPLMVLSLTTIFSGAFVAGLDAGLIYNEFPYMGESLVPPGLLNLAPFWENFFENPVTVQFQHRVLATLTATSLLVLAVYTRKVGIYRDLPRAAKVALNAITFTVCIQYLLGYLTLVNLVPVHLASTHQMGALTLFTFLFIYLFCHGKMLKLK